jgi:hypothetical protein
MKAMQRTGKDPSMSADPAKFDLARVEQADEVRP